MSDEAAVNVPKGEIIYITVERPVPGRKLMKRERSKCIDSAMMRAAIRGEAEELYRAVLELRQSLDEEEREKDGAMSGTRQEPRPTEMGDEVKGWKRDVRID